MGMTLAEKILARKAGRKSVEPGDIVTVEPDVVMSHDNAAAIAKSLAAMGVARVWDPARIVIVLDHAVPAPSPEHAENHRRIRQFVREQGIERFYDIGHGVCHVVMCERGHARPGLLVLGSDSHTPTQGALGAFAAGIGRTEMAAVWALGQIWLRVPPTIQVTLEGKLGAMVSAKDVALRLVAEIGPAGADYRAVEFAGDLVKQFSMEARMVLTNLMAEAGAKTAMVPPDEVTALWLKGHDQDSAPSTQDPAVGTSQSAIRNPQSAIEDPQPAFAKATADKSAIPNPHSAIRNSSRPAVPDPDAVYERIIVMDVAKLEPQVAAPHSPANARPVGEVAGVPIDQVFLGSCAGGMIEDLRRAADLLRGRRIAPATRMIVVPASMEIWRLALKEGLLATFAEAGTVIGNPGCGPCLGAHQGILAAGERCLSTANRNFRGRMGNRDSEIYLANASVAAATALAGRIADPRKL